MMISYAQNAEDVVLERLFHGQGHGFYVDAGAAHPVKDSVTHFFSQLGWRGLNVEPVPSSFDRLQLARDRDVNVNCALGAEPGAASFYVVQSPGGGQDMADHMSTLRLEEAEERRREGWDFHAVNVDVRRLEDLLAEQAVETIDFVKIDVEGSEGEVVSSVDWTHWSPRVIVVEATQPGKRAATYGEWEHVLHDHGYQRALFDGLNCFYVRADDEERLLKLSVPANVLDSYVPHRFWSGFHERARRLYAERYAIAPSTELRTSTDNLPAQEVPAGAKEPPPKASKTNASVPAVNDLATRVAEIDSWYHTIELPGGVVTPGIFDHPDALKRVPMPRSLEGKRCLDVGTGDGFWAFAMEQRGAAEVVGLDLGAEHLYDWPPGQGPASPSDELKGPAYFGPKFGLAHEALGSNVQWVESSIYEISPERLGTFDFVFLGSILLHLRDPVGALSALRTVVDGRLLVNDAVSMPLTLLRPRWPAARLMGQTEPTWWIPNVAGLSRELQAAGFRVHQAGKPYFLRYARGRENSPVPTRTPIALRPLRGFPRTVARNVGDRLGIPHAWALASPRPELAPRRS